MRSNNALSAWAWGLHVGRGWSWKDEYDGFYLYENEIIQKQADLIYQTKVPDSTWIGFLLDAEAREIIENQENQQSHYWLE